MLSLDLDQLVELKLLILSVPNSNLIISLCKLFPKGTFKPLCRKQYTVNV